MKRWVMLWLVGGVFFSTLARADMIETKKEGIMSGKVLSENEKEVQFRDTKGQTRIFKKKELLFMEKQDPSKTMKRNMQKALTALKDAAKNLKKNSKVFTQKLIGSVSRPLDRSKADEKSAAFSRSMDEASLAATALAKKNMKINSEINRQTSEGFGDSSSKEKKGHFSSLGN